MQQTICKRNRELYKSKTKSDLHASYKRLQPRSPAHTPFKTYKSQNLIYIEADTSIDRKINPSKLLPTHTEHESLHDPRIQKHGACSAIFRHKNLFPAEIE